MQKSIESIRQCFVLEPGATNPLIIPAAPAPTAKVIIPPDRREEDILLKTAMISRSPKRRTDPMFFFLNCCIIESSFKAPSFFFEDQGKTRQMNWGPRDTAKHQRSASFGIPAQG